jgi:hypothetical protein
VARKLSLTKAIADEIIGYLLDGSPPFLALAAERAGVCRHIALKWVREGEDPDKPDVPLRTEFSQRVRQIRATWTAAALKMQGEATRDNGEAARQRAWILERLERELFSVNRTPAKAQAPEPPPPPGPMTKKEEDALATPEEDRVH